MLPVCQGLFQDINAGISPNNAQGGVTNMCQVTQV